MPDWLSLIDVTVVSIIVLFAWGGSQKGFAAQLAHVLTLLISGVLIYFGFPMLNAYLGSIWRNVHETYLMWIILIVLAVLAICAFMLFKRLLAAMLKMQISDGADKVNGLVFGLIRGVLSVFVGMTLLLLLGSEELRSSFSYKSYSGRFICREVIPMVNPHVNRTVISDKVQRVQNKMLQREEAASEVQ